MDVPREFQGRPVLYHARIPRDVQERAYTYRERTHPTESGRLLQVDSLVLVEWDKTFMVYEVDAEGALLDDTWFETVQDALDVYNDVDWHEVETG